MRNNCAIEAKRFYNSDYTQMSYEDFMKKYRDSDDRSCIDARRFTELAVLIISSFSKSFSQLNVAIPALCESIASSKRYRKFKKMNSAHIKEMKRKEIKKRQAINDVVSCSTTATELSEFIEQPQISFKQETSFDIASIMKQLQASVNASMNEKLKKQKKKDKEKQKLIDKENFESKKILEESILQLREDLSQQQNQYQRLKKAETERRREMDELKSVQAYIRIEQTERRREMDELENAQAERRREMNELENARAKNSIGIRQLETNVHELETNIVQLETNVHKLKSAQGELKNAQNELENAQAERHREMDELENAQAKNRIGIRRLETNVHELETNIVQLETKVHKLKSAQDELKSAQDELESAQAKNSIGIRQLETNVHELETNIVQLETNVHKLENAQNKLKSAQAKNSIGIRQLEKAQAERSLAIRQLQANISKLESTQPDSPIKINQLGADIRFIEEQVFVEAEENIGVVERAKRALLLKVEESDDTEREQVNEEVIVTDIQVENLEVKQEISVRQEPFVSEQHYPLHVPIEATRESISILQYLFKMFSRFPFKSINNLFNRLINLKK
ncbi:conserved hypothetical protein [Candidatus Protochlamydia naegleriophila]|uniref:Uncharacterized protein n=1 Tax=Candidatus Protochlamydia naegleriophila TaxID=389348 RepID=A0A0U5JCN1_9BACT|nr:hypothetical protein [Candidatus Protochlamydia naegleriophila]CUI16887.1 conserved hypothetical protein [Candidatus Protochlamydia naegleriophila]